MRLSRILGKEGSDPQKSVKFYKVVVQVTLLLRAETWVMYPRIGDTLGGLHHRVAHWLDLIRPMWDNMVRWVYPLASIR